MTANIPKLWTLATIGNVAEVIMGQSPPGETYNVKGIGLPFFQGKAEFGVESPTVNKWCPSPTRIAESGDILLSVRAPVGPTNMANQRCGIGRGLAAIRAIPDLSDSTYLLFYFQYIEIELASLGTGSTFPAINRKDIETFRIPLPPLSEQRRIAAILRQADLIRQWRQGANEKTDVLLVSLFNYLFGDFSRQINFPVRSLESIAKVVSGVAKGRRLSNPVAVPYLRVANVQAGYLDLKEIKSIEALPEEVEQLTLEKGDVLLTEGGDYDKLGRGALLDVDLPPNCIHQNHVFRVRIDKNQLIPIYFATYLLTSHARTYFLQASKRTTNLASINLSQLKALSVPVPPLELQEKFAEMVSVFRAVEQTQTISANKLEDLFASLQSRAFIGELTSLWRETRKEELQRGAVERDKKLGLSSEVAIMRDAVESHLTPEEEEQFIKTTERIAEKIASFQPNMLNITEKLVAIPDFSVLEILASRMVDQEAVVQNMQKALSVFALSVQTSLAQMAPIFNTTGSMSQALVRSAEAFREAFAGSLANIAADIVERARREQELVDVELTEEQKGVFTLLQNKTGYFSARSISQEYGLQQQDVMDILALFESIGMVVNVDIPDEINSTPTFPVFESTYRNSLSKDDSRVADLEIIEANTNESGE